MRGLPRGVKENGGRSPQVNEFSLLSRALASYFGLPKELLDFSPPSPLKRNTIVFCDIDRALSLHVLAKPQSSWYK